MGVMDIPGCIGDNAFCNKINGIARRFVYFNTIQNHCGPCNYFRDTRHMHRYLRKAEFLVNLNNEKQDNQSVYDRFSALEGLMLVMFERDTTVYPKESEWFFQNIWNSDTKTYDLTNVQETDFYQQDYIGLRALQEANKVSYISIDGEHLQFTNEDVQDIFIPFLQ